MAGSDLENLIAAFMLGRDSSRSYGQWPEALGAELRANPDVVLRSLGTEAILRWLETEDGYGFVVEALRAESGAGRAHPDSATITVDRDDLACAVEVLKESPNPSPFTNVVIVDLIAKWERALWPERAR